VVLVVVRFFFLRCCVDCVLWICFVRLLMRCGIVFEIGLLVWLSIFLVE